MSLNEAWCVQAPPHGSSVLLRPAVEAVPQAAAAPPDLDRDRDGLDRPGPSEGDAAAVPAPGRPAASGDGEEGIAVGLEDSAASPADPKPADRSSSFLERVDEVNKGF